LARTQDLVSLLVDLNRQLARVSLEQQELLRVQRDLIQVLLKKQDSQ
jgi:hypothetical protein